MAANTVTDSKKIIDTTTKALEDATVKAQGQYFSLLEQGQARALEGFATLIDAVGKTNLPTVPGLDAVKIPADAFEGAFDFASKVLENQRQFATKVLAVGARA
jgi:hypothetical protein